MRYEIYVDHGPDTYPRHYLCAVERNLADAELYVRTHRSTHARFKIIEIPDAESFDTEVA